MRLLILCTSLCVLSACSGNNLDNPVKTCKAVTAVLLGSPIPTTVQETQQQTDDQQVVTLNFQLLDAKKEVTAVCSYKPALVGEDSGVGLFGEFERVPSSVVINGQSVPKRSLFDAINQATLNAGSEVLKDANKAGLEMMNDAKDMGKQMANDVNDVIQNP